LAFFQKLFSQSAPSIIGLDIGSTSIKLAQIGKTSGGLKVLKLAVQQTPSLAVKDGTIVDQATVAQEIKDLIKKHNISLKQVVSAVSGQPIVIRTITMPVMTQKELDNSIRYEAERYIPYSVAEANISGHILRNQLPGDDKNMEVLLMAAPKEMINNHQETIIQSGLQVEAIELEPVALPRIMGLTSKTEELRQTISLINIGAGSTSITIVKDGVLRNSRTIAIGGNSFTKAIAQGMNLSFEDAEKLKKEKASVRIEKDATPVAPTVMRLFNTMLPVLIELVTEIQRSFDFYRSRYRGESVDLIYLSGGTAKFKNLDRYLGGELGVHVELLRPFQKLGDSRVPGFTPEEASEIEQASAVVLGLACRHLN
jgi:type IV pilus assembly protein PilM